MKRLPRSDGFTRWRALPAGVRAQLGATLLNSASTLVKLFLPLLLRTHYGLDYATIGVLMGLYGAATVGGAYLGGVLTDRVQARGWTAACLLASGVLGVGLAQLPALAWLFVIVPVAGAADGAFRPANLRCIMESVGAAQQGWLQGLHRTCYNLGVALASLGAAQWGGSGDPVLFVVAGAANLAGGVLLLCDRSSAAPISANRPACRRLPGPSPWSDRPFLLFLLGQLLALGIFDQMYGTFGLFLAEAYRLDAAWIGYLFAMNALLIVALQIATMRWIEREGLVRAARVGVLLLAMAFPLLNLGAGAGMAVATMLLLTFAELLLTPAWTLAVLRHTIDRDRGQYLGLFTAAWVGHPLYGPACGLWLYGALGGRGVWWACAAGGVAVWCLHYRAFVALAKPAPGAAARNVADSSAVPGRMPNPAPAARPDLMQELGNSRDER